MDERTMKGGHYVGKHCSPFKDNLPYSCLSHNILTKITKALNNIKGISFNNKGLDDKQLYSKICHIIQNEFKCKNEACWLNIRKLMKQLSKKDADYFREHFRPHMPKEIIDDYTEWISNFDIEAVLNQYHNDLDDFYFYGAVPIDFKKCSVSNLCRFNLNKHMNKGENRIGIVFNTDESDKSGKHWISMLIDILGQNLDGQPGIYFFDSFGTKPSKEINNLITKIKNQGAKKDIDFVVSHNEKSFQRNSYACGFYCMHFLEHMLMGESFKKYLGSGLTDKKMKLYINQCYLHPEEIKC